MPTGRDLGDGAHDRQCDKMIAAGRERHDAGGVHRREKFFDPRQRIHEIDRIDRRIAEIGAIRQLGRAAMPLTWWVLRIMVD